MILFSIVVVHYDKTISDAVLLRCLDSIDSSIPDTMRDEVEVLLYHDGPMSRSLPALPATLNLNIVCTDIRHNDYGHSLRDLGINAAKGDYIINLNADNVLYKHALLSIKNRLLNTRLQYQINDRALQFNPPWDGCVFAVYMQGMTGIQHKIIRNSVYNHTEKFILTGYPPIKNNIDAMQLVLKRSVWMKYGGWYDKSMNSDGNMYPKIIAENKIIYLSEILGEHW